MRFGQITLARFVVAVFVTLSLAVLPVMSLQAMAGHHVKDAIEFASATASVDHAHQKTAVGSCEQNSNTQSEKMQLDCCDMSCSTIDAFQASEQVAFALLVAGHFENDADQLVSRITFWLKRPPRA